jgi:hypothetical protein
MHPEYTGSGLVRVYVVCKLDGQLGFPITLLVPTWRNSEDLLPEAAHADQSHSLVGFIVLVVHPFLNHRTVDKIWVGSERHHEMGPTGNRGIVGRLKPQLSDPSMYVDKYVPINILVLAAMGESVCVRTSDQPGVRVRWFSHDGQDRPEVDRLLCC